MSSWTVPEENLPSIGDLIMQYIDDGYDVTIIIRHTGDKSPGKLSVPTSWAIRLGMDLQKSGESR